MKPVAFHQQSYYSVAQFCPTGLGQNCLTYRLVAWRHQPSAEPMLANHQMRLSFAPESDSTRRAYEFNMSSEVTLFKLLPQPRKASGLIYSRLTVCYMTEVF